MTVARLTCSVCAARAASCSRSVGQRAASSAGGRSRARARASASASRSESATTGISARRSAAASRSAASSRRDRPCPEPARTVCSVTTSPERVTIVTGPATSAAARAADRAGRRRGRRRRARATRMPSTPSGAVTTSRAGTTPAIAATVGPARRSPSAIAMSTTPRSPSRATRGRRERVVARCRPARPPPAGRARRRSPPRSPP